MWQFHVAEIVWYSGVFVAVDELDELDVALVTMGEVSVALAIQHRIINLINFFHLILMPIISFDVFFLLGKTLVIVLLSFVTVILLLFY